MHRLSLPLASFALVLALPVLAHAEVAEKPFNPTIEWRPTEFPWDSGYVPASGPLRVNLHAALFQEVLIAMEGVAAYDWDAHTLAYHGTPDTGVFRNTLGAEVTATIAVDALGVMLEYEIGVWNIEEIAEADFTPYLLPGNPDRPALIATAIGPFNLADEPFSVGPLTGTFTLDYMFDVPGISYLSTRVALDDAEGAGVAIAVHDVEDEAVDAILPPMDRQGFTSAWATLHGDFDSQIALHLYPTVTIDIGGVPFAIGPFDMVVDYPIVADEPVVFEDRQLMYEVPEPASADTTSDDGSGSSSGSVDGDVTDDGAMPSDESTTTGDPEPGTTETSSTAGSVGGGFGEDAGSGCGCTTVRNHVPWMLLWFLPLAVRRRTAKGCNSLCVPASSHWTPRILDDPQRGKRTSPMTQRSPIAVFFLPVITLGIYGLIWLVKTKDEMNTQGAEIPTAWLLLVPIVSIWWVWKFAEGVGKVTRGDMGGGLALVLLLLLGNIGMAVIQSSLNKRALSPAMA